MLIQLGASFPVPVAPQPVATAPVSGVGNDIAEDTVSPESESAPATEAKVPGVLRNLQAGKYKGVADVRLRIVFQQQLAELAEQQAIARAAEGSETLVSNVAGEIRAFVASPIPTEAEPADADPVIAEDAEQSGVEVAITEFSDAVSTATNILGDNQELNLQAYESTLQTAFDALVSNLEIALTPEAENVMADLQVTIQDGDEQALDVSVTATVSAESEADATNATEFLASLREMFAQELAALLETAEPRDILPPLSGPHGNGRAYDKFKVIYDEMNAADPSAEDNTNIDVEA